MERAEWLRKVRSQNEVVYDHLAPAYWVTFGFYANATHRQFITKFLGRLEPPSAILDAACGAGRYDGMLVEAGHDVLGIDQSGKMLARAREHFPQDRFPRLRYAKTGLQEMDFEAAFDGVICIDALEHVGPEDWPEIVTRFRKALKPGGVLYVTVEVADWNKVGEAYERAKALRLPVVYGEVVDGIDAAYAQTAALDARVITGEQADVAVYHYYPSPAQVQAWFEQAGLRIAEEAIGDGYAHFLMLRD
jgi:2-polyprenyl-3-methyl-5-hydroxy-6-metoxy-1,4-benzoquinol methylase